MKSQLDVLDAKIAMLMLKAGLEYNAAINTLATQTLSAGQQGKAIKFKHIQREVDRLTKAYAKQLQDLIMEGQPDEQTS